MHLDAAELRLFVMELGLILGVAVFMYVMYRVSLRRMEKICILTGYHLVLGEESVQF